jgi:hypothetical protein
MQYRRHLGVASLAFLAACAGAGDAAGPRAPTGPTAPVTPAEKGDWSRAAEWTTYQANYRHTGFVDATLDTSAFREKWVATPLLATAYYQPTLGPDRLYLAADLNYSRLLSINPADGSVVWSVNFGTLGGINQATYDNGALYIASGGAQDTFLWALNASDGSRRFKSPFESQFEHWNAPVVAGNTVVQAGGMYGGIYGFDAATGGRSFFLSGLQSIAPWTPAVAEGRAYATGYGGGVRAIAPADGGTVFDIQDERLSKSLSTPVLGDRNDLLSVSLWGLIAVDLTTRTVSWARGAPGEYVGMPVVGNGVVYAATATRIDAVRESDGSILWSWAPSPRYAFPMRMVLTDNVLFVTAASNTFIGTVETSCATRAIDLASHAVFWSYPMCGEMVVGAKGVLYIAQRDKVAAIGLR